MLEKVTGWLLDTWKPILIWLAVFLSLMALFSLHFGKFNIGLSDLESAYLNSADSIQDIADNPIFLPHKLLTFFTLKADWQLPTTIYLPSALFATSIVLAGISLIRKKYSQRILFMTTLLVISSSWLLSLGRLALPEVSLILWVPLLALLFWFYKTPKRKTSLLILTVLTAFLLYIPGYLWIILGILIWQYSTVTKGRHISIWFKLLCAILFLVLLAPMGRFLFMNPKGILSFIGFPIYLQEFINFPANLLENIKNLVFSSNLGPVFSLGRLPLLDIFTVMLVIIGLYAQRFNKDLSILLTALCILFSLIIINSGGLVTLAVVLPLIYLLAGNGLRFMLQQWFTVFPLNPLARSIGTTLLSISVFFIAFYHLNKYFVAWSNALETKRSFNHSLIK